MRTTRRSGVILGAGLVAAAGVIAAVVIAWIGLPLFGRSRFVRVTDVRPDWATLPILATIGPERALPYHRWLPDVSDTYEGEKSATLGPFELRWHESSYHSRPATCTEVRVCDPDACHGSSALLLNGGMGMGEGNLGMYCRPAALRRDPATATWIVSMTCASTTETVGVAFRDAR
jgi:hypothetical protein